MLKRLAAVTATIVVAGIGLAGPASADGGGPHHPWPQPEPQCTGDVVVGSVTNDTLFGTNCDDIVVARAGNDTLFGRDGADVLAGGPGRDRLFDALDNGEGEHVDVLRGGRGFDLCVGDVGDRFIACERVLYR